MASMKIIWFWGLLFLFEVKNGYGAADIEVERVQSPYVESRDIGPMMQSEDSQPMMRRTSAPFRSYSTYGRQGSGCLSCQYGEGALSSYNSGGMSGGGSSSYSSSSSYSQGGMGMPVYSQPQQSSSRHELRKEKEYVNGQQIYDFHHEKKYKDGKLIDEKRHENTPDDFGVHNQPEGYSRYSSSSSYQMLPQTSYQQQRHGFESDTGTDHFDNNFENEFERLQEELRRKTLATSYQQPQLSQPTYGGSHRSEFRTESKYVNGKPVYMLNEERKYKDGQLIHDVKEEKGPNELGIADIVSSSPLLTSPTGKAYSSQREVEHRSQTQNPSLRYPSQYPSYSPSYYPETVQRPTSYNAKFEESSGYSSNHQQPYYRPSAVYSSEVTEERKEVQSHSPVNTYPNNYHHSYNKESEEDLNENYNQAQQRTSYGSYYRPETNTPTTTTSTTIRPLDYGRPAYNPRPASRQHNYEENSSSTHYSRSRSSVAGSPNYHPEVSKPYETPQSSEVNSEEKIREASQSSYYDVAAKRNLATDVNSNALPTPDRIRVVDHDRAPSYRTGVFSTYSENQDTKIKPETPSQQSRITDTSRNYHPGVHTSSSTQEEYSKRVSSEYNPTYYNPQRPDNYNRDDEDKENDLSSAGSPTSNQGVPGFISGPEGEPEIEIDEEQERYDISPYDDESESDRNEDETKTKTVQFENYPSQHPRRGSPYDSTRHSYHESSKQSEDSMTNYGYRPQRLPVPDRSTSNNQRGYSSFNTSRTDHITQVLPSRWVETKTTWKYLNGKLVSETQHHRYYENGIMVHENTTRRTRDEMDADGIDTSRLDLTVSQLSEYGPALKSSSHSQKHEVHQIQRFRNGQQIYELNHERRFQDGNLVHENRDEKDEDDFEPINYDRNNYQNLNQHSMTGETGLYSTGLHQGALHQGGLHQGVVVNPRSYSRKHEVQQEEQFVNGQKVYDFHHEREFQDGKLIRENKTELGPDKLGVQSVEHRDALKEMLSGRTQSSIARNSLLEQQRTADSTLKTSCITCGAIHGSATMSSHGSTASSSHGSILGSLGLPVHHGYSAESTGSSYRQDLNVEEHYENGQLVKGREAKKKWVDGQLIDAKEEHYYDGPSRANITTNLASDYGTSAALLSAPIGRVTADECSYNPCRNKGTCKASVRGPICICAFGFKGTHCEEAYCPNRFCRYGGSCSIYNGEHACSCPEGYSGYRCSARTQSIRIGVSG